jgi:hypothetical protein
MRIVFDSSVMYDDLRFVLPYSQAEGEGIDEEARRKEARYGCAGHDRLTKSSAAPMYGGSTTRL